MREHYNYYSLNKHIRDVRLGADKEWRSTPDMKQNLSDKYVLYTGAKGTKYAATAEQWSAYEKKYFEISEELPTGEDEEILPGILIVDARTLQNNADNISVLLEKGVNVICAELPSADVISRDPSLMDLLGINDVRYLSRELDGIQIFPGFLLGGWKIFSPVDEEEKEKRQDLDLDQPWYVVKSRTKTYIQGIPKEDDVDPKMKNEDYPALLWKNSYNGGQIYAIAGDFMQDPMIGMGFLSAITAECGTYVIYPVVNAQSFSVINYPELTDENSEVFVDTYGMPQTVFQSIEISSTFSTLGSRYELPVTEYMAVQYAYDGTVPNSDGIIEQFLINLNYNGGELGISLDRGGTISLDEKIKFDQSYLRGQMFEYKLSSAYVKNSELNTLKNNDGMLSGYDIKTIVSDHDDSERIISFFNNDISLQRITSRVEKFTYTDELRLIGLETALGYSNMGFDMAITLWPQSEDDEWQKLSKEILGNMTGYIDPFLPFDAATASESDAKVRAFLDAGYTEERNGDTIDLSITNFSGEASFILRTHQESVSSVTGGKYAKLEDGAYLITANNENIKIFLK